MELYKEVSAEVEPAIKLDREIIQELQNRLNQELEGSSSRLISELKREGKSVEKTKDTLMKIFQLTEEEAEEKVKTYWQEK